MRRKFLGFIMTLCFAVSSLSVNSSAFEASADVLPEYDFNAAKNVNGFIAPIDDPDASAVKITNADELMKISEDMYGSYVLMNDIDMSDYGNWSPIGKTLSNAFHGKFDGQGHTITGLKVSESFGSGTLLAPCYAAGLFGICDGAQIKNVSLKDADISIVTTSGYRYENSVIDSEGTVFAGAIAGYVKNSTAIYNCNVSGSVSASASGEGYSPTVSGGLAGYANTSLISYCYNAASVLAHNGNATTAENAYAGGLLGRAETECIIDRSYNGGSVFAQTLDYGNAYAGGMAGDAFLSATQITNSFNEGSVQGLSGKLFCDLAYAGGIAAAFQGTIDKVYNSGEVTAQAKDPYGINDTKAYAGGICANSGASAKISNSAVVQANVSASASGRKYQYRISNSGTKSNNVTIGSMASGSTNDADHIKSLEEMKMSDVYESLLGWDFADIWEIVSEKDFPQLKQVDTSGETYKQAYIEQHIDFINQGSYKNILDNYRWAQIYWSEENNFKSNLGGALYNVVDATLHPIDTIVDLSTLKMGDFFDDGNPFYLMLADYVSDQASAESVAQLYKAEVPYALDEKYKLAVNFIKENWDDSWEKLEDEDLFYLFHYDEKPSEEWVTEKFEDHLAEIVEKSKNGAKGLETIVGVTVETLNAIIEQKEHLDNATDWFNELITFSGHVAAYAQANEEFHMILEKMCNNLPASNLAEIKYKAQLYLALISYTQYDNTEYLKGQVFANYLAGKRIDEFQKTIKDTIKLKVNNWIKAAISKNALEKLNIAGWFADKTWKICEYVTKNGELQTCREMLKANAYFEEAMYRTLKSVESQFITVNSFENACLFDAAFKFFKETQICSMDIIITYFDTYQTSWLQAIRNFSNTFMNSAIEEVHINKLFLYCSYCHGVSYPLGGKVITIACPTDVYIYDEDGGLAASIENNAVTYCADPVFAYTSDAIKVIAVPAEQNYCVQIDAAADGSMSYSISEYNANQENVQTIVYSDIAICEGESFLGTINNEIETEPETYHLTGPDRVVDKYEVVTEATNIPVEDIKIINSAELLSVGDKISLQAEVSPADAVIKSVAWSSSDTEVIRISENGELTALKEGAAIIRAQSIYGGIFDAMEITVISDEHTLFITKHPQSAKYVLNESARELVAEYYEKNNEDVLVQWYAANDEVSEGTAIAGAVGSGYVPKTDRAGRTYYYAKITDSFETRESKRAFVEVVSEKILDSGKLNDEIEWELTGSLALRIKGTGELSFDSIESAPWSHYRGMINALEVSEGITDLGLNAVNGMSNLKKLALPKSIRSIEAGALNGCSNLVELEIPFVGTNRKAANSKDAVLGAVFGDESSDGIIQYYALLEEALLECGYDIPNTLKTVKVTDAERIPVGAFSNLSNLNSISLNAGVAEIEQYAFYHAEDLENVYYSGTESEWSKINIGALGNEPLTNAKIHYISEEFLVCPDRVFLERGQEQQFTIKMGNMDSVLWSVEGNRSAETVISENGLLHVSAEETADVIYVKAAAASDAAKLATAVITITEPDHIHDYGTDYQYDAEGHWQICKCNDRTKEEAHIYGEWEVTEEASCTKKGTKARVCGICSYKDEKEIAEKGHNYQTVWNFNSENHWKECECGEKAEMAEHSFGNWFVDKEADCTGAGIRSKICKGCGYTVTEKISDGKHTLVKREAKEPTCTLEGNIEYYECTECGKYFKDINGAEEIEPVLTVTAKKEHFNETSIERAGIGKNGCITKKCADCGMVRMEEILCLETIELSKTSYTYTGKTIEPSVTVKDSGGRAVPSSCYKIKYSRNRAVGTAEVRIAFEGNYAGTVSRTFSILPKGTSVLGRPKAKTNGFLVKWKKRKSASGYQVQYSTDKKFTKKKTVTKTIKKKSAVKLNIGKLKANKKYYVRVRVYQIVKGKRYESSWSKSKMVKTKK